MLFSSFRFRFQFFALGQCRLNLKVRSHCKKTNVERYQWILPTNLIVLSIRSTDKNCKNSHSRFTALNISLQTRESMRSHGRAGVCRTSLSFYVTNQSNSAPTRLGGKGTVDNRCNIK